MPILYNHLPEYSIDHLSKILHNLSSYFNTLETKNDICYNRHISTQALCSTLAGRGKRMFSVNSWSSIKKFLIIIYVIFTAALLGSNAIINFSNVSNAMNKEISHSQNLILGQISNTISSTMTSIERALYISSTDKSIQTFFETSSADNANQIMLDYAIQDELKQLSKIYNINSIYLYNKSNGKIVSDKNCGDLAQFPDTEWLAYCASMQNTYSWIGPRKITAYNETVVSLIRTYPITSTLDTAKGFIVINITNSMLTRPLQNIPHSDTNEFFILNTDNNIIFRSSARLNLSQDAFTSFDFSQDSGIITSEISDEKRTIFYTTNDKTHWKLVSVCTYHNLMTSITTLKYYFIVVFLGVLIILIIGILLFSRRMYSPIDHLVNSISHRITVSSNQVSLAEIENIFHYTYQKNENLNQQIQESLPGIKWKLINSILSNKYKDFDSLQSELEAINYSFYAENFIVVLSDIDEIHNLDVTSEEIELFITSLSDKAEEQFNNIGRAISSKLLNNRVITIVSFIEAEQVKEKSIAAIQTIQEFMRNCFNITLTTSLSDMQNTFTKISAAFHQATELQHYKAIIGYNSILTSDTIKPSKKQNIDALNTLMDHLETSLKNAPQRCFTIIERLFDKIIAQSLPQELIIYLTSQILFLGIRYIGTSGIQDKSFDSEQYKNLLNSLSQYETVPELRQFTINIYHELLSIYENNNKSLVKSNDDLMENIIQFIMKNYGDYDLSMSMLSEKFAISQSYLSKLLKDYSGKSFMELLIETRLKNAERLLRTTNLKVNQIAEKVGYNNSTSFVRVFKKYYYLKPTEYRNKYILDTNSTNNPSE